MPPRAHRLAASLSAGLTVGILTILTQASFATLLYNGPLAPSMGLGFLLILSGAVVIGLVLTLAGSYPGTVGRPHELPIVILALLGSRLVRQLPATHPQADPFATVLVMIAGTTFLFGLLSLLMGVGRAGNLFRFLPYPVLGGFVAGSGMLLAKGGFSVMLTSGGGASDVPLLLQAASLPLWLPGVAFGLAMFLATRLCRSWLTIPAFLVIGLMVFHGALALSGSDLAQARAAGLLPAQALALSPGDLAARWPDFARIAWGSLGRMIPDMLSVAFIASLGTLMNASAIEATIGRELDFNRDLKAVGLANLLAACVGSPAGFHSLSATALPQHMGVRGRSAGLISSLLCLVALLGGQGLVNQIPYAITGGLLLFLGLSLLGNWLVDQRVFLSAMEYSILLAILLVMLAAGWMAAIIFGLILAVALFTFDYSRISAIRLILTGRTRRSNVDRDDAKTKVLERYGDAILILCLQGHLFFGTAHGLLQTIGRHLESRDHRNPHWVLIDMKRGSGIDASAINTLSRIKKLCNSYSVELILTAPSQQILHALRKANVLGGIQEGIDWFQDLDHGLEYCENELLAFHAGTLPQEHYGIDSLLEAFTPAEQEARDRLLRYLKHREWPPGSIIIQQGSPPVGLHFILTGRVSVERRNRPDEQPIRLRTMDPGTCIGEISFYLRRETTASVIARTRVCALSLDDADLARLEEQDPAAAILLHKIVSRRLGERLILTNELAFNLSS
ncbi:MAG: SulP family inorganic anion transporter [Cyanobacteriota bacterium]|jgi:SulP family sulfate permease